MRVFLIALVGCSGAPSPMGPARPSAGTQTARAGEPATLDVRPPVDIIAILSQPALESSWIMSSSP